jgi:coenzyme F420-reducing hydrogenase delta subunit
VWGNYVTDKRVELARALMGQLGLDQGRLRFEYIGVPMQAELVATLWSMDEKLRQLGPNPVAVARSL